MEMLLGLSPQPWLPALSPSELCSTGNTGSDTHPEPPAAHFHVLENKNRILIFRLFSWFGTERLRQTDGQTAWVGGEQRRRLLGLLVWGRWIVSISVFSPWQLLSMATTESRATRADLLTSSEEEEDEEEEDEEGPCAAPWKIIQNPDRRVCRHGIARLHHHRRRTWRQRKVGASSSSSSHQTDRRGEE